MKINELVSVQMNPYTNMVEVKQTRGDLAILVDLLSHLRDDYLRIGRHANRVRQGDGDEFIEKSQKVQDIIKNIFDDFDADERENANRF